MKEVLSRMASYPLIESLRVGSADLTLENPDIGRHSHNEVRWIGPKGKNAKGMELNRQTLISEITKTIRDVTDSAAKIQQYSKAVEENPAPIMITDALGYVQFVNRAFAKISGYESAELIGRHPDVLKSKSTPVKILRELWQTLSSGKAWQGELSNRRKDGSVYWGAASISPIRDSSAKVTHFIGILHDLTPLKEIEAKNQALAESLRHSEKMSELGAKAANVAHDFNNILAVISGFAHAGLSTVDETSVIGKDLQNILSAVTRGKELVRGILSSMQEKDTTSQPMDLGSTLKEAIKDVRAAIPAAITIKENIGPMPKIILGNESEWHRVITNLCVNAAHAIGDCAGTIGIELHHNREVKGNVDRAFPHPYIELAIHDTGCGIASADLPNIFQPFFTTKNPEKGTGLGLSIVHSIVTKAGGRIWAENRKSGGATIRILLPAYEQATLQSAVSRRSSCRRVGVKDRRSSNRSPQKTASGSF